MERRKKKEDDLARANAEKRVTKSGIWSEKEDDTKSPIWNLEREKEDDEC